jgi:hypothetical protein
MRGIKLVKLAGVILLALWSSCGGIQALSLPSGGSGGPTNTPLDSWSFYDQTNWTSDLGDVPLSFTNLSSSRLGDADSDSLVVDTNLPAWLRFNVTETNLTNLTVNVGSVAFWFAPGSWASTNVGGTGPGEYGRLFEAGAYTTNSSFGWWSIFVDPAGGNLYFATQTNDLSSNITTYISYPISWTNDYFHFVVLTYSPTNTALFLDGVLATNGPGVTVYPGPDVLTNGFCVGSDSSGVYQAHGLFNTVQTYGYPLDSNDVQALYNWYDPYYIINPYNSTPQGGSVPINPSIYGNNLALTPPSLSSNLASLFVVNSAADILYEIQGTTNLAHPNWVTEGFVDGSELTNLTAASLLAGRTGSLFLRIRSWQDTTGTGIPDWWWLTYFGQITNVDANAADPAGDGYGDLQKFQMGLNPTNYYNPNPPPAFFGCLDASGTNAFLEWSNAPGPVVNYIIQRGIQDTNNNYSYSQIGVVSSNATFFEDVGAITNANAQNNIYNLWAVYAGGGNFSGTNSWTVWWYANAGSYGPPYGPPTPGNFWANADATGTNVLLSWTPAAGDATNYAILLGIYNPTNYAYNYTLITNVNPATTNLEFFGALTNDSNWTVAYEIEAVYPGGGIATPITTLPDYFTTFTSINVGANSNAPAAPGNFYGYTDSTGTNIFLSWSPVSGAVTNYIVYGGVQDATTSLIMYHQLATLGAATNSFEVTGAVDGSGNNLYAIYNVVAVYTTNSLSQSAAWYPGNGAPAPGALYAWLDSTGTNVQLSWTAATAGITGYLVERSDDYSYYPYEIGEVGSSTTALTDINAVNTGYFNPSGTVYQVQAKYPNGGLSPAVTAMVSDTPAAPTGLTATVDTTGNNVNLTWTPAVGAVSGYTILRGTYNQSTGQFSYSQIGTTSAGVTSFQDTGAITGNNAYNNVYEVEANYAGGILSSPSLSSLFQSTTPPAAPNLNVTAQLVRNQTGRWQLMFSGVTTNMQAIALDWYYWDYFYDIGPFPIPELGYPFSVETDIPVSSLTNGAYVIPDNMIMSAILLGNVDGNFDGWAVDIGMAVMVQPISTNGDYGNQIMVGILPDDQPAFADGRQCLKQNMLFALRAAGINQPNASLGFPVDTNYVESSLYHLAWMDKGYGYSGGSVFLEKDDLWPFAANYSLHQNLYDTNYTGPTSFTWQGNLATDPAPAILGVGDPYWIPQPISISSGSGIDPATGLPTTPPYYNISLSPDMPAYTNGGSLYMPSSAHNLFGLAFEATLVNEELSYANSGQFLGNITIYGTPLTVAPGSSIAITNVNCYFSQTADPGLQLVNYYFAPVNSPGTSVANENPLNQPTPIPTLTGFASTNQTGMMVASVGTPTSIGGWAKFAITNGSSSKFAYLGQYYVTNAFVVTNGVVTTNIAGTVSPYGDFFPTLPGMAALVTMPDIDTEAQGTGVVDVISLNVDANHDGTMDFSYQGPDFVSQSKPFRFWADDSSDSGDFGGTGIPGQGAQGNGMLQISSQWEVHGRRDLVNLFPVCLNIGSLFQSNALTAGISVTNTSYQFVLSQADGALRFAYTDLTSTNYMNFLQDTNETEGLQNAQLITVPAAGVPLSAGFLNGIATANLNIILVQAWESTTQPLVLTIYHGTNQIAQTSLPLSITGVEQMFRHKNLLMNIAPAKPDRLTDADVPNEPDTIDKNFVFLHGYNVLPDEARGVAADMFKRMYWSGSHAKFWAVTWEGADTKIGNLFTPNYHTNVVNAFNTAPLLANFIATLTNFGPVVAAAHSLGNMVTLSAISDGNAPISQYFMMDAAVPIEAIDPASTNVSFMTFSTWAGYSNRLFAANWYQRFPTNDARNTLFWNNRLGNLGSVDVYNFYSSGEEVLRTAAGDPPLSTINILATQLINRFSVIGLWPDVPLGTYTWYWQEKGKGTCNEDWLIGSSHGGWKFSSYWVDSYGNPLSPAIMNDTTNSTLQNFPMFNFNSTANTFLLDIDSELLGAYPDASASTYAATNRNRILSDAIPAMSLVAGANPVPKFNPTGHNADMTIFENGWSQGRTNGEQGKWHHSDFVQMAYTFTYGLFNQFVTTGNLK